VSVRGGKYYVNDAEIISANIITDNGVIHVIDKVRARPLGSALNQLTVLV
jgi:uncharacterized surface protein with fasciclin (FAS1) repeats